MVWSVAQDHVKKDLLFAGTEFGIYATLDGGKHWVKLGGGVPTISFRDIEIQERESDLVGASFGRGFYVLDDYSPLRARSTRRRSSRPALLFPVKKALLLHPADARSARAAKELLGETFYLAPNPPFGAVFTYYLKDALQPAAEARREEEKKLAQGRQAGDVPGLGRAAEGRAGTEAGDRADGDRRGRARWCAASPGRLARGCTASRGTCAIPPVDPTQLESAPRERWEVRAAGAAGRAGHVHRHARRRRSTACSRRSQRRRRSSSSRWLSRRCREKDKAALLAYQKKAGELQRAMMGASRRRRRGAAQPPVHAEGARSTRRRPTRSWRQPPRPSREAARGAARARWRPDRRGAGRKPSLPSLMDRVSAQLGPPRRSRRPCSATTRSPRRGPSRCSSRCGRSSRSTCGSSAISWKPPARPGRPAAACRAGRNEGRTGARSGGPVPRDP